MHKNLLQVSVAQFRACALKELVSLMNKIYFLCFNFLGIFCFLFSFSVFLLVKKKKKKLAIFNICFCSIWMQNAMLYYNLLFWILFGLIRPQDEQKDSSSLFPPEVISNGTVIFFHFINLNTAWIKCTTVYLLLMWENVMRRSKKFWVLIHLKIPFHSVWYSFHNVKNPEKYCIITLSEGLTRSQTINYPPPFITPKCRLD